MSICELRTTPRAARCLRTSALAFIAALAGAADGVFVVPAGPQVVEFSFLGESQADRDQVQGIPAGAEELVVSWMCANGSPLEMGDRMMVFDPAVISRRIPVLAADLEAEERNLVLSDLRLASQMQDLLNEQISLRAELDACRAALATAAAVDPGRVAALKAAWESALLRAEAAEAALARERVVHDAGHASDEKLAAAQEAAELARIDCRVPEVAWRRAEGRIDTLGVERQRLRERQLRAQLGLDDQDHPVMEEGINARIAAARKQQQRQHEANALNRDKVALTHHVAARDASDHTPIQWIEISGPVALKVAFQPPRSKPREGWAADPGAPYDDARGYGWLADATTQVRANDPDDGKPGSTLAVIGRRNTWRARVPDGAYHVKLGLGDRLDWDGAMVRLGAPAAGDAAPDGDPRAKAVFVTRRINAKAFPTVEADVVVTGGRIDIVAGDTCERAIRAPENGIAVQRDWVRVGFRTHSSASPVTFFMDPRHVSVRGRVHQDLVPLLRTAAAATAAAASPGAAAASTPALTPDAAQRLLATASIEVRPPGAPPVTGSITKISNQPVALSRAPVTWSESGRGSELVANEVEIAVPAADAPNLRTGEEVECRGHLTLAPGMAAVPGHLVANVDNHCWIQEEGARHAREVSSIRVVGTAIVLGGVAPGMRLVPPTDIAPAAGERSYSGRVKAGARTPVVLSKSWGRIKEMVEDGAHVTAGEPIITLYNPSLEEQAVSLEQDRKKANQAYQLAADTRQVKNVQAAIEHRSKVLDEKAAHLALTEVLEIDPLVDARADAQTARAQLIAADRLRHLAASEALQRYDQNRYALASADARRAAIDARAAELDQAAAAHSRDWFTIRERADAWQDALGELSLREAAFRLARTEEQVAALTAKLKLAQALEGNWAERQFNEIKRMKAPATGRLFYKMGWNDQANATSKYQRDFPVWSGQPIAEVLDMSRLSFVAELPEALYRRITPGAAVAVRFPQFNNRRLDAQVKDVGKAFRPPTEGRDGPAGRSGTVAIERVFTVTVSFTAPPELQDLLVPETKGALVIP